MSSESFVVQIIMHLAGAIACGGAIGIERSYNGHNAGLRTHVLVSMASCLLMMVVLKMDTQSTTIFVPPAQMAQGIMTGIGFLGAGVILKSGLNVRGLTTAACIWMTAALGIMIGVGYYSAAGLATVASLIVLCGFRFADRVFAGNVYAKVNIHFPINAVASEDDIKTVVNKNGIAIVSMDYSVVGNGESRQFEYAMTIRSRVRASFSTLKDSLLQYPGVTSFKISLSGE